MPTLQQIRDVKKAAKVAFGNMPGVGGIGIGDGVLRVYVQDAGVIEQLPRSYQGIDLEFVITGELSALDS